MNGPPDRDIWVVVPAKVGPAAKSRLSASLAGAERGLLMTRLLTHTLECLAHAGCGQVAVVTSDGPARELAAAGGLLVVADPGRGPNAACATAARAAAAAGARYVAVIAADLPLLGPPDVLALLRHASPGVLALAPDRLGIGTNAVLSAGPFPYSFGPDSFARHLAAAAARRLRVVAVRTPGLGVDLDLPADLDLAGRALDYGAPPRAAPAPVARGRQEYPVAGLSSAPYNPSSHRRETISA